MTTSLSVASIIEKNRLSSDVPWLILLDIDIVDPATLTTVEKMHLVRNPENITYNGAEYTAAAFDIGLKSEAGAQSEISLSINDYSLAVQRKMQDYGGGVGFAVTVVVVNAANLTQPPEVIEYFQVTGAETANYVCTFKLGSENNITKAFPRRRQTKDYCQWRYKSAECGYTGQLTSCDLSLKGVNGCEVHQNVVHFGAFPGINSRDSSYG